MKASVVAVCLAALMCAGAASADNLFGGEASYGVANVFNAYLTAYVTRTVRDARVPLHCFISPICGVDVLACACCARCHVLVVGCCLPYLWARIHLTAPVI